MATKKTSRRSAKDLASFVLHASATSSAEGRLDDEASEQPSNLTFAQAEDLYFAAETPEERDAVFSHLAQREDVEVHAFMAAVMAHDEDPHLKLAAAHHLALRGVAEAQIYVVQTLLHAQDDLLFEQALQAVIAGGSPALLEPLAALWQDEAREPGERRLAMLGMRRVDASGATALWKKELMEAVGFKSLALDRVTIALFEILEQKDDAFDGLMASLQERLEAERFDDPLDKEAWMTVLEDARLAKRESALETLSAQQA